MKLLHTIKNFIILKKEKFFYNKRINIFQVYKPWDFNKEHETIKLEQFELI